MNFYTEDIAKGYNWKGLERALARLMGHLGWKDTNVIGGAGDMGGDILGTRIDKAGAKSWVVQSKAVSGDRYIGPQAIKEAIDALTFYQATSTCLRRLLSPSSLHGKKNWSTEMSSKVVMR